MRTGKELYQVFEDNQHLFGGGLCGWLYSLNKYNIISFDEMIFIGLLLEDFRVSNNIKNTYYWPFNEIKPRLEWLKQTLIK